MPVSLRPDPGLAGQTVEAEGAGGVGGAVVGWFR